jgi:hypothetical protein
MNAPDDSTIEQLRAMMTDPGAAGALVITDNEVVAAAVEGAEPTVMGAAAADGHLDALPRVDLAVVDAEAGFASEASAIHLVSRLRDVHAAQVIVIGARESATQLGRQQLIGLGFRRWATTGEAAQRRRWYEFSLADYKVTPDWLNPRHWANPELWDRYRW